MTRIAASLALILLVAQGVEADVPSPPIDLPRQANAERRPLAVSSDSPDGQVHLRVPRKLIKSAAAAPVAPAGAGMDSSSGTAMAGLALSGAIVAGGFWLLRYRKRPVHLGKVAATTATTMLLFGCGLWGSWLDAPVPPPLPIPGAVCSGRVIIEPVDDGDKIEVLLPKDMAAKLGANTPPR